jgi:hypothetical protein
MMSRGLSNSNVVEVVVEVEVEGKGDTGEVDFFESRGA